MTHKNERVLSVAELSRVEGEGALYVRTSGNRVEEARLDIYEPPRFFEAFLRGRSFTEPPDITARICGICPVAYQMSACAAIEDACGVTVGEKVADLRRLLYCGEWIESHALHIYLLHAPDFLGYRSGIEMATDRRDLVERGLALKKAGNAIMEAVGGRAIHPVNVRVGGFYRAPARAGLAALTEPLKAALDVALDTATWVAGFDFPDYSCATDDLLALINPGTYAIERGTLATRSGLRFSPAGFDAHVIEEHVPHSTALHAHLAGGGRYLTGPLARYALSSRWLSPLAREAARAAGLGETCDNPFRSIIVRAVETVYAVEEALRLIAAYEPPEPPAVEASPRAATGHGATEAPRGALYHRYDIDAGGLITSARIVPPTSQNQAAIEADLRDFVQAHLDLDDAELTRRCEQAIRNYDPCISCSTHFLDLTVERSLTNRTQEGSRSMDDSAPAAGAPLVVIGVGNEFRRDDGAGPAVVARLRDRAPANVRLLVTDGEPARLVEAWTGAALAVVVDAVRAEPPHPGRVHRFVVDRSPALGRPASSHGFGLDDAVGLAVALDRMPGRLIVHAIEAADLGQGPGLTPPVAAAVPAATDAILADLEPYLRERSYALLADGTTMTIRPATPEDYQAVKRLHEAMSPDNLYFRFFSASRVSAEREARRVCLDDRADMVALLGLRGDDLVGLASYELTGDPAAAEIALAVADGLHRRGIATLLLEHLVSLARSHGVQTLVADVLPDNYPVLHVLADAGLAVRRRGGGGVIEISMPVPPTAALGAASTYLDAVADREKHADVASLAPLLAPRSVAVIGADPPGRNILLGIRDAGFSGALYSVRPAGEIEGIPRVPSVADLPEPLDLAMLTVPAGQVVAVARACGQRGVRSLAVITRGLTPEQESGLLAATRHGGMRLIGPDSSGVAVPGIALDATSGVRRPAPGRAGIAVQSGGVGAALAEQFSRLGVGISSFVSVGGMLDVSGTDMLLWWGADESTELAVLYLESFGNARQFARTARRASAMLPVLTVHGGHSAPGQRAAASHTAAAVAPLITRQALFEQAGIIATTSFGELLDAAALVASQPIPAGHVVAVVSDSGGAAVLTADACAEAGLTVAVTGPDARDRLRRVLPAGSWPGGPVNATGGVGAQAFSAALRIAAEGADALIAVLVRGDLVQAVTAAPLPVPVTAVVLDQPEAVRVAGSVPVYAYPEAAARALARAARYGSWRGRPPSTVPEFSDLRADDALSVVTSFLARMPGGGWLSAEEADNLLRCYGIPMVRFIRAADADAAAAAAGRLGGHVVVKADVPGLLHKSAAGAVELDLNGAGQVRAAVSRLQAKFAGRLTGVLVEPMITGGAETIVGVVQEPVFGPVVVFGLGGVATDVLGERAARLAPLTVADAGDLTYSIPAALPDPDGLRDILLRVSRLADDLPQVAELDLNPVIARPDGAVAVDARIRVSSHRSSDPFLRQLPR